MRRVVVLTAGALAALALASTAGCSSSTKGTASTNAGTVVGGAQTSRGAATSASASASTPAGSSDIVDVCSLLTAAQATTLNKVTYSSTTPASPAGGMGTCTYKNTGSADPIDIQDLTVTVVSMPACWSELKSADGPGTAISGVGDAAFGAQIGIDFEVGSRCVTIRGLTHAEIQGNYAPDIAMAKIIIAKLG